MFVVGIAWGAADDALLGGGGRAAVGGRDRVARRDGRGGADDRDEPGPSGAEGAGVRRGQGRGDGHRHGRRGGRRGLCRGVAVLGGARGAAREERDHEAERDQPDERRPDGHGPDGDALLQRLGGDGALLATRGRREQALHVRRSVALHRQRRGVRRRGRVLVRHARAQQGLREHEVRLCHGGAREIPLHGHPRRNDHRRQRRRRRKARRSEARAGRHRDGGGGLGLRDVERREAGRRDGRVRQHGLAAQLLHVGHRVADDGVARVVEVVVEARVLLRRRRSPGLGERRGILGAQRVDDPRQIPGARHRSRGGRRGDGPRAAHRRPHVRRTCGRRHGHRGRRRLGGGRAGGRARGTARRVRLRRLHLGVVREERPVLGLPRRRAASP